MLVHYANRTILLVVMFVVCALSALGRADNDVRLSGVTIRSLAIDPQDAKTLYAATPMSIYKSRDGGASWSESSVPSPMFINGLQVNLKDSNTIYAAAYNDYDDGVFKSVDGGLSWTKLLNVVGAWALAIDPQDSNTLYVGAGYGDIGSTPGVFSTHDGGLSWKRIAEFNVYTLLIDPQNSQIVYAGGPRALMRTSDGGNTWSSNRGTMYVSKLVIDGNDPDILYAASLGPYFFHAPRIPDLLKTTDAGATWTAVPKLGMVDVWSLTIDPLNTHTVYAGTSSGVWKTEDGGITWSANLILTLSTPSHCTGSAWELGVSNALANAPIRLAGTSNGKEWAIENWGITDSGGTFAASGIFTEETLGVQSLHVEVGDARSNSVTIGIDNCKD